MCVGFAGEMLISFYSLLNGFVVLGVLKVQDGSTHKKYVFSQGRNVSIAIVGLVPWLRNLDICRNLGRKRLRPYYVCQ
jgi:hypothetical protein